VIVSGFVALTLSPMMASRMLKHNSNPGQFYLWGEKILNSMANSYEMLLRKVLKFPFAIIAAGLGTIALSAMVYIQLPQELSPSEDRGFVIGFAIAPEGSSTEFVDKYTHQIEGILDKVPEANSYFSIVGFPTSTNSMQFVQLAPWEKRERSQQEITASLMGPMFGGITGVMSFPMNPPSLGQSIVSRPVEFVIQTTGSYEELQALTSKVMMKVWSSPMFAQPDIDLKLNKPELAIDVDREKAATIGVGIETIGRTLETMIAGREITRFKREGEQYNVIVQVADVDRSNPNDLTNVYVRSSSSEMVQLANLVTITETIAPKELNHFNKLKSATIQAALNPGFSQQQAREFLDATVAELSAGQVGIQVDYGGQLREFIKTGSSLTFAFSLALIFIYLVLAAQFESFRGPLIIMFSVPTAMLGALLALWLTSGSINVYSQIGLITLVGLITKHGILIVEFANQLQESGFSKLDAVIESAKLRLRPILMTTAAMVLGAIPLALATGAGAESREQIGWTIVGGMTLGTALTIIIVPACYLLIAGKVKVLAKAEIN
jgi:multidrug efflux pump